MADDPFAFLVCQCQISSFQEEILRICPFARQSEVFPEDESPSSQTHDTPVDPTGIVMVSLSESSKEDEEFQTPLEESLLVSSEEQRESTAVDALTGQQINGANDGGDGCKTMLVDDVCIEAGRTVDLSKDSGNLGFSGVQLTQVIDDGVSVSGVRVNEVSECQMDKFCVLHSKSSDDGLVSCMSRKLRSSVEIVRLESPNDYLGNNEPMTVETYHNLNVNTGVLESDFGEIDKGLGLSGDTMNVNSQAKQTEEGARVSKADGIRKNYENGSSSKNIEDLDNFKYVASRNNQCCGKAKDAKERRELPSSLNGKTRNLTGESVPGSSSAKNQLLKDLLDGLKMVSGELDDGPKDVDFLETAKRRCITFPRPRWWPREGS